MNSHTLCLDLGTQNLLITDGQRILKQIATAIAEKFRGYPRTVLGHDAEKILVRPNEMWRAHRPLQRGVISDLACAQKLLGQVFKGVPSSSLKRGTLLVSAPLDISPIERNSFFDAAASVPSRKNVVLVPEPTAVAVGLRPAFLQEQGVLIVDIGAGISEAVVFSLGGVAANSSLRIGGDDFESALIQFLQQRYEIEVGSLTAQRVLAWMAADHADSYLVPFSICGRDTRTRMPGRRNIELMACRQALDTLFRAISAMVLQSLERLSPEISALVGEKGLHLTGGASQYARLREILSDDLGVEVVPDSQPLLGVARGHVELARNHRLRQQLEERL